MLKRFIHIALFMFPVLLFSQQTELLRQEVCWNPGTGPDSSLVRYVLVSPQTSQIQILFYTDAEGTTVNPVGGQFSSGFCDCCDGQGGSGLNIYNSNGGISDPDRVVELNGASLRFRDTLSTNGYVSIESDRDIGLWSVKKRNGTDSIVMQFDFGVGSDYTIALDGPSGTRNIWSATSSQLTLGEGFDTFRIQADLDTVNSGNLVLNIDPITKLVGVSTQSGNAVSSQNLFYTIEQADTSGLTVEDSIGFTPVFLSPDGVLTRSIASRGQLPGGYVTSIDGSTITVTTSGTITVPSSKLIKGTIYYLTYEGLISPTADSIYQVPIAEAIDTNKVLLIPQYETVRTRLDDRDSLSYGLGPNIVNQSFNSWSVTNPSLSISAGGDSLIFTNSNVQTFSGAPFAGVPATINETYQQCITLIDHPTNPNSGTINVQLANQQGTTFQSTTGAFCDTITYLNGVARYWLEANSVTATNFTVTNPTLRQLTGIPKMQVLTGNQTDRFVNASPDNETIEFNSQNNFSVKDVPLSKISELGWIYVDNTLNEVIDTISGPSNLYINKEITLSGNEVVGSDVNLIFGINGIINYEEFTLQFTGSKIQAGNWQIFQGDTAEVGNLTFTSRAPTPQGELYSAWFGMSPASSAEENRDAFVKCLKSVGGMTPSRVRLPGGNITCESVLYPGNSFDIRFIDIEGGGERPTDIIMASGETNPFFLPGTVFEVEYSNFTIDATNAAPSLPYVAGTFGSGGSYDIKWNNVQIRNYPNTGMIIRGGQKHHLDNVYSKQNSPTKAGTTGIVIQEAFGVWIEQPDCEYNEVGIKIELDTTQSIHRVKNLDITIQNTYNEGNTKASVWIQDAGGVRVENLYDGLVLINVSDTNIISLGNTVINSQETIIGQGAFGTQVERYDSETAGVSAEDSLSLEEWYSTNINGNLVASYNHSVRSPDTSGIYLFPDRTFGSFAGSFNTDSLSRGTLSDCLYQQSGVSYPLTEEGNGSSSPTVVITGIRWDSIKAGDTVYIYSRINVTETETGGYINLTLQTSTEFFDAGTNTFISSANSAIRPSFFPKAGVNDIRIPVVFAQDGPAGAGQLRFTGSVSSGLVFSIEYIAITDQPNLGFYLNDGTGQVYDYFCQQNGLRTISEQTSTYNANPWQLVPVNTTGGAVTVNPPSSPDPGDEFGVFDSRSQAGTNNITIDFVTAGQNLNGSSVNEVMSTNGDSRSFRYIDSTIGWTIYASN